MSFQNVRLNERIASYRGLKLSTLENLYKKKAFEDTVSLISESFGYCPPHNIEVDFYPLLNQKNSKNLYVLTDIHHNIVAHIGLLIRETMPSQSSPVLIGEIGGLCISKKYQGQGIFKSFLTTIIENNSNKVDYFTLWGELDLFYRKFQFSPLFTQVRSFQQKDLNILIQEEKFERSLLSNLNHSKLNEIKKLYNGNHHRFTTLVRTDKDWENICAIKSAELFVKSNDQNKIVAYFLMNKGMDLNNIIHEFSSIDSYYEKFINHLSLQNTLFPHKIKSTSTQDFFNPIACFQKENMCYIKKSSRNASKLVSLTSFNKENLFIFGVDSI